MIMESLKSFLIRLDLSISHVQELKTQDLRQIDIQNPYFIR